MMRSREQRDDSGSMTLGTTGLLLTLGLLALIDATSIGTLVIPLWMVLRAKQHRNLGSAVLYLGVLGTFYLAVGLLILGGATWLQDIAAGGLLESPVTRWAGLVLGAGLLTYSLSMNTRTAKALAAPVIANAGGRLHTPEAEPLEPHREGRWNKRLDLALGSRRGVALLGITAGLLELPTMLPYLGAIGLLSQSHFNATAQTTFLVLYCALMLVPGLVIIGLRALAGPRLTRAFDKLSGWLERASKESMAWVIGIIGFLLMRSSLVFLFPEAAWNPFK